MEFVIECNLGRDSPWIPGTFLSSIFDFVQTGLQKEHHMLLLSVMVAWI
jgi:hypothetical protein